ncbi:MAG: ImmA/IrrE family metallo-endopeptidase [Clostridiales bacterium]|jgi:hypothetical protein|nr:ImmA/IrrE family metallo-endopeptidase [Clostridiales bacterium]
MSDREIDEFAYAVLKDYKPDLLKRPGEIDYENFLEQYLKAWVEFHDIYSNDPDFPILALTTFTDGEVNIFDSENECVSSIFMPARTIVLDNSIADSAIAGMIRFSALHEAGHLMLHWRVFVDEYGEPYTRTNDTASVIAACRRDNIENSIRGKKQRTAADWREHQADYFAAAVAMPTCTFRPFVNKILRKNGYYKGQIQLGCDSYLDILADDLIPEFISETYGVSKRAARIKLRKAGFVTGGSVSGQAWHK